MARIEGRGIVAEFQEAPLPDARLRDRLEKIAKSAQARPDSGFPQMFGTEAELESFYRFVRNDRVDWESVVAPHVQATVRRASGYDAVVVAHDTCEFRFGGRSDRAGLTRGRSKKENSGPNARQGFHCHMALAVTPHEDRAPLGVLAMFPWARTSETPTSKRSAGSDYAEVAHLPSEQDRWAQLVEDVEDRVGDATNAIHVMDSEADDYALLANLTRGSSRFVIRMCYDRIIFDEQMQRLGSKTKQFVAQNQPVCTRRVKVSSRKSFSGVATKRGSSRTERQATLSIKAAPVTFRRPANSKEKSAASVCANVVLVQEVEPPEGVEPVEWMLVTSESIDGQAGILQVVDYYRARWRIEEFFKAIKSGCAYEKRQLESLDTLLVALAMFVPVAWQLLHMRTLCRADPALPADRCLSARQLVVLRLSSEKTLPDKPTVRDALLRIARLGGHLKRNGEPGWQTLGRGLLELMALERGFLLASAAERCDQS